MTEHGHVWTGPLAEGVRDGALIAALVLSVASFILAQRASHPAARPPAVIVNCPEERP